MRCDLCHPLSVGDSAVSIRYACAVLTLSSMLWPLSALKWCWLSGFSYPDTCCCCALRSFYLNLAVMLFRGQRALRVRTSQELVVY